MILRDADASLRVNGDAVQSEQTLALGDRIATADGAVELNLIRVDSVQVGHVQD